MTDEIDGVSELALKEWMDKTDKSIAGLSGKIDGLIKTEMAWHQKVFEPLPFNAKQFMVAISFIATALVGSVGDDAVENYQQTGHPFKSVPEAQLEGSAPVEVAPSEDSFRLPHITLEVV